MSVSTNEATSLCGNTKVPDTLGLCREPILAPIIEAVFGGNPDDRALLTALLLELILREQGQTALRNNVAELASLVRARNKLITLCRELDEKLWRIEDDLVSAGQTMPCLRTNAQSYRQMKKKREADLKKIRAMVKKLAKQFGTQLADYLAAEV